MHLKPRCAGFFVLPFFAVGTAHADGTPSKQACVDAYVSGQVARRDGRLLEARERFELCSQPVCPDATTRDCRKWREDVEAQTPSVVFEVRDRRGNEASEVHISIDGNERLERVDARALPLDPGKHRFDFEIAGEPKKTIEVTVLEGIKSQKIAYSFAPKAQPERLHPQPERPIPSSVYVLGAVGLVGLGAFTYFAISSERDASSLRSECGPYCSEDQRDAVRHKQVFADVSLGIGLAAIGAGTWIYLTRPSLVGARGSEISVGPTPGAFGARLRGTF